LHVQAPLFQLIEPEHISQTPFIHVHVPEQVGKDLKLGELQVVHGPPLHVQAPLFQLILPEHISQTPFMHIHEPEQVGRISGLREISANTTAHAIKSNAK
jgi:hypothetical protein